MYEEVQPLHSAEHLHLGSLEESYAGLEQDGVRQFHQNFHNWVN